MNAVELAIKVSTDATDATRGLDAVGDSAAGMASAVEQAGRRAEGAAKKMDRIGESADNLDSKAGQATGSLGALSSGFELVGAEKYATGLQAAAMATDFMSGVGQALNLVMNLEAVATARATASKLAHAAASKVAAAGAAVMTAAQWAMNAAFYANPIGLVVLAVLALVAAFVVAYKKSETFRNIVQAVGRVGAAAIGFVVDKVSSLVGWLRDKAPAAAGVLKSAAVTAFEVATLPLRTMLEVVKTVAKWCKTTVPEAFGKMRDKATEIGGKLLAPFQAVADLIERILKAISKIKLPKLDVPGVDIPGFRLAAGATSPGRAVSPTTVINLTVNGALDPAATARQIETLLARQARRLGRVA